VRGLFELDLVARLAWNTETIAKIRGIMDRQKSTGAGGSGLSQKLSRIDHGASGGGAEIQFFDVDEQRGLGNVVAKEVGVIFLPPGQGVESAKVVDGFIVRIFVHDAVVFEAVTLQDHAMERDLR